MTACSQPLILIVLVCSLFDLSFLPFTPINARYAVSTWTKVGLVAYIRIDHSDDLIWNGKSGGLIIRWTTEDFEVHDSVGNRRIFAPMAKQGFTAFEATARENVDGKTKIDNCNYQRSFEVLSVVGPLMSFKDNYYADCGGAHPSEESRFTTIDLRKSVPALYTTGESDDPLHVNASQPSSVATLLDYFEEKEIVKALAIDSLIKPALPRPPGSINDFKKLIFGKNLGNGPCFFTLNDDFLTRFAFHHLKESRVAVRVSLSPIGGACRTQTGQLGLLLTVPPSLKEELRLAASERQGFLMKDAKSVSGGRGNRFVFKTGLGAQH